MDQIIFTDPNHSSVCDCCGAKVLTLCRDIESAGQLYATYFAKLSVGPEHAGIAVIAGLGDWSQQSAAGRTAFAFRIWREENNAITRVAEGDDWAEVNFLGTRLSRQEALDHPWLPNLFALSDFIVDNDPIIAAFLNGDQKI